MTPKESAERASGRLIKAVYGRIRHPRLLSRLRAVAPVCGRAAAAGLQSLDRCNGAEYSAPRRRFGTQQEPGNRSSVRCVAFRNDFTHDLAAIARLPGGAGVVFAHGFTG